VDDFLGRQAVAYDVHLPARRRATLYVVKASAADLNSTPPVRAVNTAGRSVAAWKTGPLVYVLVFDAKDPKTYRLLVPPGPIT
jgi:hypothetical protein